MHKPHVVVIVLYNTVSLLGLVIKLYVTIERFELLLWQDWLIKSYALILNFRFFICIWSLRYNIVFRGYFVAWVDAFHEWLLAVSVNSIFNN